MLVGKYEHKLDGAGRVAIPARFRFISAKASESIVFYLTRGPHGCIRVYTEDEMHRVVTSLTPKLVPEHLTSKRNRLFLSSVHMVTADAQGRIVIPPALRALAQIQEQGEVVIVGMGTHFEIWAKEKWNAWEAQESPHYDETERAISEYTKAQLLASLMEDVSKGGQASAPAQS